MPTTLRSRLGCTPNRRPHADARVPVGFLLVMTVLAIGFTDRANAATIAYLSSGAGILTEIISGIFFYLYNRTVRQMKTYHDSLLAAQNILLSFKLLDDTEGGPDKAAMVTYLVGRHEGRPEGPRGSTSRPRFLTSGCAGSTNHHNKMGGSP